MSVKSLSLDKDLCRCCHAEGSFDDLAQPYCHDGKDEVYSDMIKDSFNIEMRPVPGQLCVVTYKICKLCIERLRDAFLFKTQVQDCEVKFMDLYNKSNSNLKGLGLNNIVKEELTESVDIKEDYSPIHDYEDDDYVMNLVVIEGKPGAAKQSTKKSKTKSKSAEAKPKKSKDVKTQKIKQEGRREEEPVEASEPKKKKGGWKKFILRAEDYKKDDGIYHCLHCDKNYSKVHSLRYHLKAKHYKTPRYVCKDCSEEFMTLARFTSHKLEVHEIDDRFKCNACKGAFNTRVQLRKHIDTFHMMGQKHKCEHCKYESFSYEGLYKHKIKHKSVKDYHCRFCRKSFLRKANLELHERIHTGDRRKVCQVCCQAFVQKASLNYHMSKYHPDVNY